MSNPITVAQLKELERAVQAKGLRLKVFDVRSGDDIERAFEAAKNDYDAVTVGLEGVTQKHRHRIAELSVKHRLPAIYGGREFIEAGGLISYAPAFTDIYRRAAAYVDKIFKGVKPGDLP